MRIALVHDYLTQRGGAERVFELLCKRFPNADIFTSLYDPKHLPAGQLITSGSGSPDQAVEIWNRVIAKWRVQQVPEYQQYKRWAAGKG